jgi:hypothetical protein
MNLFLDGVAFHTLTVIVPNKPSTYAPASVLDASFLVGVLTFGLAV